jgi:hypothetical protein
MTLKLYLKIRSKSSREQRTLDLFLNNLELSNMGSVFKV